jgi:hypothetical protein
MTNPTSNFGWQMPTPTDLVTDLPADFEVFGQAVDTSLADLQGGTTGQILAKATNADMDFAWITNDVGDITAVNVTSPITGGGSSGAVTIGINAATTSVVGAVQLSDSTSTTSSVLASTPTATKAAYDLADAAIAKSTLTTAGDVLYRNATVPVRLGIGTAGQVLQVNSGATAPEWATAASGGMTVIASGAHSGTTIDIQSIPATYNYLYFTWSDYLPTTDGDYLRMRFNNVATANYNHGFNNEELNVGVALGAIQISQTQDNAVSDGQGAVTILDYKNTTSWKFTQQVALTNDPGTPTNIRAARIWGFWNNTSAINRVQVVTVSGNSFNLNYVLYGVK